ncbi:MAG: 50S ribosomal protein L30 [Acidobacteria bacterium]|nr:50S ribosomal protein L30 [Acidobacteriota bacterium]
MAKQRAAAPAAKMLKVTLIRSTIGFNKTQAKTVEGMGLRRLRHTVELPDTPATRGMIHKVRHLVEVTE